MASRDDLSRLSEGQTVTDVPLSSAEAAALNASGMVTVIPQASGWAVTAQHVVGTLSRGDLLVRVTPKVGAVQVLTLLARAEGASWLTIDNELVHLNDEADLSAVLARLFCDEAQAALAGGPLRGYRTEDQTLPVLRGRVRLRDQYLRRFGQLSPLEVTVDEWTVDTDENRLIRSAAHVLLQQPGLGPGVELALRRIDRMLTEVQTLPPGAPRTPWNPTRLNARLHNLLGLSDLVRRFRGVENDPGATPVRGFWFNMSTLFERLLGRLLTEADSGWYQPPNRPLDRRGELVFRPDFLREDATGVTAVADAKYKLLGEGGKASNADIYQLVTYCARLGLKAGHLVYADGGEVPAPYEVPGTGVAVAVHRIDLTLPPAKLEERVRDLAGLIAEGRNRLDALERTSA